MEPNLTRIAVLVFVGLSGGLFWLNWHDRPPAVTSPAAIEAQRHAAFSRDPVDDNFTSRPLSDSAPASARRSRRVDDLTAANAPQFSDSQAILKDIQEFATSADTNANDPVDEEEGGDEDEPSLLPISGWVFERGGEAVPGIGITAKPRRLAAGASADLGPKTAVSDADGYFAFAQLPEGEYELRTAATEEFTAARQLTRTGETSATLIVDAADERAVTVSGSVVEPNGQPIQGVTVTPIRQATSRTGTDASGNYRLRLTVDARPGSHTLRFVKDGYRTQSLPVASSDLRDTDEWHLDARLEPEHDLASVNGVVIDDRSEPVPYARVQLHSASLGRNYGAISDGYGEFFLPEVETADDYSLRVRPRSDFGEYADEGLEVAAGGLQLVIPLTRIGTGSLQGRIVNPLHEPLPGYTLWLSSSAPGGPRDLVVTSDATGHFSVDELPAGTVTLTSHGNPRLSIGPVPVEAGQAAQAEVVVDRGEEQLSGLVTDMGGEPVAGAEVKLLWSYAGPGYGNGSRRATVTDGNGYFLFSELGPAIHRIVISASSFSAVQLEAAPSPMGNEVSVQLRKTGS